GMSEPTVSFSPPPDSSSEPPDSSAAAPPLSLLSSLVALLELELLLPPPQPATTSAASASKSAAKSAAGRILVIESASVLDRESLNIRPQGPPAQAAPSNLAAAANSSPGAAPQLQWEKYEARRSPGALTRGQLRGRNLGHLSKEGRRGLEQAS